MENKLKDSQQVTREQHVALSIGDILPVDLSLQTCSENGSDSKLVYLVEYLAGRRVVLVTVPNLTCKRESPISCERHLSGFIENSEKIFSKGVDEIICVSTATPTDMKAWANDKSVEGKITFLSDNSGKFTRALRLAINDSQLEELQIRRGSIFVDDGVVRNFNIEESEIFTELSGAAFLLSQIKQ